MLTKTVTNNGQARLETLEAPEDAALRALALKQLERIRSFRLHLAMFVVGMPAVTAVWVLTEYMNADGWPERFSDSAGPGSWNPWILWVLFIWGGLLAIQGVRAYFGRPPTESEIDREIARLKTRG